MARNLINQVPCFLFTLKSLELRQGLNLLEMVRRNSNFIYCRRFLAENETLQILETIQTRSLNKKQTNEGFS